MKQTELSVMSLSVGRFDSICQEHFPHYLNELPFTKFLWLHR